MATEIAKAYVQIIPSAEGIGSGVQSVLSGSDVTSATKKAGSSMGSTLVKGIGTALVAGAATVTAAAAKLWSGINATAEVGDSIDKTSQKLQVTAEEYQTMAYAAEHCGFSTSVLTTAQKNLSSTDFTGSIYDAIGYVQSLGTEEERTAAAVELFGTKAAQQMQPLINGTESIDEYSQALSDLGGMMSNEAVANSAAFEDALTDMNSAMTGRKNTVVADMMPACTDIINGFAMIASGQEGGEDKLASGIENLANGIVAAVPTIIKTLAKLAPKLLNVGVNVAKSIIQGLTTQGPALMTKAQELFQKGLDIITTNLPKVVSMGMSILTQLISGIASALPNLVSCASQIITSLTDSIFQALPSLIEALPDMFLSIMAAVMESLPILIDTVTSMVNSLVDNLPSIIQSIVSALPGLISGIINNLIKYSPKIVTAGVKLFVSLVKAMPEIVITIVKSIPDIITGIVSGLKEAWPDIKAAGVDLLVTLKDGLSDAIPKLKSAVSDIADSVKDWFSNGFEKIKDIGADIITGLWNGINDKVQWLKDKISSFTSSVLDSIKSFFKIGSPSKLMADEVGKWIPEGIAVGIDANTDSLMDSVNYMDDKLMNASMSLKGYELASTSDISDSDTQSNLEELMYQAFSAALDNHKISFNNRELGRLVKSYA